MIVLVDIKTMTDKIKLKCDICGEVFECGYAANMHRKECPPPVDWDNIAFTILKHSILNPAIEKHNSSMGSKKDETKGETT